MEFNKKGGSLIGKGVVRYYSDHCFVCGTENEAGFQTPFFADGERVWAELIPPSHTRGFGGVVHGGLVTALLDESMFYLCDLQGNVLAETQGHFLRVPKLEAHLQGAIIEEPVT